MRRLMEYQSVTSDGAGKGAAWCFAPFGAIVGWRSGESNETYHKVCSLSHKRQVRYASTATPTGWCREALKEEERFTALRLTQGRAQAPPAHPISLKSETFVSLLTYTGCRTMIIHQSKWRAAPISGAGRRSWSLFLDLAILAYNWKRRFFRQWKRWSVRS